MEIDSNIVVPNGHTIEYGEQVGNGKSAFKANMDEVYIGIQTKCLSYVTAMTPRFSCSPKLTLESLLQ